MLMKNKRGGISPCIPSCAYREVKNLDHHPPKGFGGFTVKNPPKKGFWVFFGFLGFLPQVFDFTVALSPQSC